MSGFEWLITFFDASTFLLPIAVWADRSPVMWLTAVMGLRRVRMCGVTDPVPFFVQSVHPTPEFYPRCITVIYPGAMGVVVGVSSVLQTTMYTAVVFYPDLLVTIYDIERPVLVERLVGPVSEPTLDVL